MAQYKSTCVIKYISIYSKLIFNIKAFVANSQAIRIRFILPLAKKKKKKKKKKKLGNFLKQWFIKYWTLWNKELFSMWGGTNKMSPILWAFPL